MSRQCISEFLVASREPDGGAYGYALYSDGTLEQTKKYNIPCPAWIEIHNGRICAIVRRDPQEDYIEYSLTTGEILRTIPLAPGFAKGSTHFCRDGEDVYVAYYASGHVSKNGNTPLQHTGTVGPNTVRQDGPHAHQCLFSPDKKFILVNDLGLDTIFVYDRDLTEVGRYKAPAGSGPRHSVFSPNGQYLYCLGEMGSSVSSYEWNDGTLLYKETVDILPQGFTGVNDAASILVTSNGKNLYASNRGANTICHIRAEGEKLTALSQTDCGGDHPRALYLLADDRYLIAANTFSHNFDLFRLDANGTPIHIRTVQLLSPLSVAEL